MFQCLRLNQLLAITLECDQSHVKVTPLLFSAKRQYSFLQVFLRCEDVELVGAILQDLCQSLKIADLAPTIHFPSAMNELDAALKQASS